MLAKHSNISPNKNRSYKPNGSYFFVKENICRLYKFFILSTKSAKRRLKGESDCNIIKIMNVLRNPEHNLFQKSNEEELK